MRNINRNNKTTRKPLFSQMEEVWTVLKEVKSLRFKVATLSRQHL